MVVAHINNPMKTISTDQPGLDNSSLRFSSSMILIRLYQVDYQNYHSWHGQWAIYHNLLCMGHQDSSAVPSGSE